MRNKTAQGGGQGATELAERGPGVTRNLIVRMRQMLPSLRPAERRVAQVVLADVEAAVRASNAQLAEAANVSEPTVTRFCRSMECEGVRDFKLRLAQSMVTEAHSEGIEPRPELPFWSSVFGEALNAVDLAERQLEPAMALNAIRLVAGAKRILVFGLGGGSTVLATDLQFRLFRFGVSISAYTDGYLMRMAAAATTAEDTVIAISATGRTIEVVDAANIASDNGAAVVAVTRPGSDLAGGATAALTVDVPEVVDLLKPTASRFAFMAVLDLLATGVAYELGAEGQETWRRVKLQLMRARKGEVLEPLGD